jgi:predicted Zn-dependent peptidase
VRSGSRSEPGDQAGISHFIEHLLFKGSDRYSAYDVARIFDEMGGEPNAATSKEHTIVYARCLDDDLEQACRVISEMVVRPSFANLDTEREVVLEEVAMYEDSPPELIHDHLTEAVFGSHPLGRSVIGRAETLQAADLATVGAYHKAHYVRPAVVIAAAGNVDHETISDLAGELFAELPDGRGAELPPYQPPERHVASFVQKDTEQYHICLGGKALRRDDPRRHALFVLDTLLGGSWSSRLFQEVRDERGLAYSVYSYTSLYSDTGMVGVYFGSREEAVAEAMSIILDELRSLRDCVPEEEIARAKKHLKGQLVLNMESPQSRMQVLGRSILFDMPLLTIDEMLARIDAVTADDVREVARDFYDSDRWSTVCIGPAPEAFRAVTGGFEWREG